MLTNILLRGVLFLATVTASDFNPATEASPVAALAIPNCPGLETSGPLLVARLYQNEELRYWDWNNLKAEPKVASSSRVDWAVVLADGRIIDESGDGLVLRNLAGNESSTIDVGTSKEWYVAGMVHSPNGKMVGIWQEEETSVTGRTNGRGARAGLLDLKTRTVPSWVTVSSSDKIDYGFPYEPKALLSDDGRHFVLFGSHAGRGWISMLDPGQASPLWQLARVADSMWFHEGGFSPDGKELFLADRDSGLYGFRVDNGKQVANELCAMKASYLTLSPDGSRAALGPGEAGRAMLICEVPSGKVLKYINPPSLFSSIAFSPDNRFLAVGCEGETVVYDLTATKAAAPETSVPIREASAVATISLPKLGEPGYPYLETSGNWLVGMLCAEGELRLWDWNRLEAAPRVLPALVPKAVAVLADGTIAEGIFPSPAENEARFPEEESASDTDAGPSPQMREVRKQYLQELQRTAGKGIVLRPPGSREFQAVDCGPAEQSLMSTLIHSKDGKVLAVLRVLMLEDSRPMKIQAGIVDLPSHAVRWIATLAVNSQDRYLHIADAAVSEDGRRIAAFGAAFGKGGWIAVFDTEKQRVLWEVRGLKDADCFERGQISPDGKRIWVADQDRILCLNGESGEELGVWGPRSSLVLSRDGRRLACLTVTPHPGIMILDTDLRRPIYHITASKPRFDVAFSPDGGRLALGTDEEIRIYDLPAASEPKPK